MMELTKSQKEILDKIKLFISKNGYAPTVRELCFLTDRSSPATIHFHLKHLKEKGYIDFDYKKNRTVKLIGDNKDKVISDLLKRISKLEYEVEKANNIINELEKWLGESIEKHTEDYLDWKYDRNVYLAGSKKLQNVLDKLQELKGEDKE